MTDFALHTAETAPEASKPLLAKSQAAFGMIPNLHAVMAEAPGLLEGYQQLNQRFLESSFDATEKTVVWQTINVEHNCHYCVPAHTAIAHGMKVDPEVIEALRNETLLTDPRLEALRTFTLEMLRGRGEVAEKDVHAFLDAGFTRRQVLEVVLALAQKVMSNYTNHLARTPIDAPFAKFAWNRARTVEAV
ncbi:MAG: carboxymuconolactone decarboxylase family protein [Sphingomicrobium sp.]